MGAGVLIKYVAWIKDAMELPHTLHYPGLLLRHEHDGGVERCGLLPAGGHAARNRYRGRELVMAQHRTADLVKTSRNIIKRNSSKRAESSRTD
jgi:hypothetical protein